MQNRWLNNKARSAAADCRDAALALLYPQQCRVCGWSAASWQDGVVCAKCWHEAEAACAQSEACAKCGLRLRSLPARTQLAERHCGRCDELAFSLARSCGGYEGAFRESVLHLKLHPQIAPRLRQQLLLVFAEINQHHPIDSIIPVPLHPLRQQSRGFNQAEVIARTLSQATGLYVDVSSLIRQQYTERHGAGMDSVMRAKSLKNAFTVRAPRLIENRSLLLVDDVLTTGSTAHEIARMLLESGAKSVSLLTIARAMSHIL